MWLCKSIEIITNNWSSFTVNEMKDYDISDQTELLNICVSKAVIEFLSWYDVFLKLYLRDLII